MERSMLGIVLKELDIRYQYTKALCWIGLGLLGLLPKNSKVLFTILWMVRLVMVWERADLLERGLKSVKQNIIKK
jgi:hypothetical protein